MHWLYKIDELKVDLHEVCCRLVVLCSSAWNQILLHSRQMHCSMQVIALRHTALDTLLALLHHWIHLKMNYINYKHQYRNLTDILRQFQYLFVPFIHGVCCHFWRIFWSMCRQPQISMFKLSTNCYKISRSYTHYSTQTHNWINGIYQIRWSH